MRTVVNKRVNTRWFKKVLEDQKLSQRAYSRMIGEDPTVVNRMFRGTRHFGLSDVQRFSEVTGAPIEAVLENAGLEWDSTESGRAVKVVGWIDNSRMVHYGKAPGKQTAAAPPDAIDGTLAFRYKTEGGRLQSEHGAVVYCRPLSDLNADMPGRWCVVRLRDGGEYVRILKRGARADRYDLFDVFGIVKADVRVEAAALVEWIKY